MMTDKEKAFQSPRLAMICAALILLGIVLRFWNITQNNFFFYDEGMYLTYNRELLENIQQFPPKNFNDLAAIVKILFYTSLTTAKWLWFFISNLRVFTGGPEAFFFTRVVSAVCGVGTVVLTGLFARRYFQSRPIALLSAVILALLPSHVFYSRLAMQESLSTFCLLGGMYLYCSNRNLTVRTIVAGVLFSAVFFTNYRMIVLPILLIAVEAVESLSQKKFNAAKLTAAILTFLGLVFWIGSLNHGSNRLITFAWMTHQAQDAPHQWHVVNLLSYPYGILVLEGVFFGLLLLANAYWIIRRDWSNLLPFSLVIVQMLMFSVASEKGARYLCVVLPFAAMAAAAAFWKLVLCAEIVVRRRWLAPVVFALLIGTLMYKSSVIAMSASGYQKAVELIQTHDPQGKILTTQPLLVELYAKTGHVKPAPKTLREMVILYAQGFRYLVIDPQAYVSWTESGERFTPVLADYLGFIRSRLSPRAVTDHLNAVTLQRFVLDHNENLINSIRFLNRRDQNFGAIYIYDLKDCLDVLQRIAQSQSQGAP